MSRYDRTGIGSRRDDYDLTRVNTLTGRTNFLQEVQLEFHFCTVLTLLDPHGRYHHLKHFTWNVHWQAACKPSNFAAIASPNCNAVATHAGNHPNVRESAIWTNFDVGH